MPDEKKPIRIFANGEVRYWFGTKEQLAQRYDQAVILDDDKKPADERPKKSTGHA